MIHVITGANRHLYEPELLAHFRLRHEIYVLERNWADLAHPDGLERDQFDNKDATYILAMDNGQVIGGSRLVPTTRPHLLSEVFPYLASVRGLPRAVDIHEWTRMFVVKSRREGRTMGGHTRGMVICGVLEHCLDNGITGLTALIEMFWLPLFHSMGWNLMPLGLPELISGERSRSKWQLARTLSNRHAHSMESPDARALLLGLYRPRGLTCDTDVSNETLIRCPPIRQNSSAIFGIWDAKWQNWLMAPRSTCWLICFLWSSWKRTP